MGAGYRVRPAQRPSSKFETKASRDVHGGVVARVPIDAAAAAGSWPGRCRRRIVGAYYLIGGDDDDETAARARPPAPAEEGDEAEIFEVVPSEATPGSALQVRFTGSGNEGVRAPLSTRC